MGFKTQIIMFPHENLIIIIRLD